MIGRYTVKWGSGLLPTSPAQLLLPQAVGSPRLFLSQRVLLVSDGSHRFAES
jgi:hypothetical protein